MDDTQLDRAIVARFPAIVKARTPNANGRRVVSVESSTEEVDTDGDVVLQKALLDSAASFVAKGHLDLDHKSEFGDRLGIPDPSSYIVGRPLSVQAAPDRRTFVEGEISRSRDGTYDPAHNHYDEFWGSLMCDPPVQWYASIYGFPTDLDDCTKSPCPVTGAMRFVIKALDWRSLAFTRTPKNTALNSPARIVTAKAFLAELVAAKAEAMPPSTMPLDIPQTMDDAYARSTCKACGVQEAPSLLGYRRHFAKCAGLPAGTADLMAHAVMYRRALEGALKCR
jgi:hypothetical protein